MTLMRRLTFFGLAGLMSNAINIAAFWFSVNLVGLSVPMSGAIAYFLGMFVGFFVNHKLTFASSARVTSRFVSYTTIQILIFFIYFMINISLIARVPELATSLHILAIVVCAIINFCLINFIWKRYGKS